MTCDYNVHEILPHRSPFLFITRILEVEENHRAVAEFYVPPDMDVFKGHFPSHPVLPGVLILEMLAQTGAIAVLVNPSNRNRIAYLAGIDRARFKRPVMPGETMRAEAVLDKMRRVFGKAHGSVYVGDEEVLKAEILFAVAN
jgi:3-hydroxyacyl-[acyl-carrier-protein] dehydratase